VPRGFSFGLAQDRACHFSGSRFCKLGTDIAAITSKNHKLEPPLQHPVPLQMAPITRSSLHGRSISREASWQIPTEEDLQPEQNTVESVGDAESVEDETAREDSFDDASDGDPFHEHQGMYIPLAMLANVF
jgi:hypothetical protein